MEKPTSSEKPDQIEVDCINALAGAAEVKNRVLSGLALGYPSIESSAYLIKCRVKEHSSLVEKVQNKRECGNPDYSAKDATDIVGLRLLALFRGDLPTLVNNLLNFLRAGQSDDFSLFVGNNLADACSEIIVYTAADPGDQVDQMVFDIFRKKGIRIQGDASQDAQDESKIIVKVVRKESRYSSIHLIVWCRNLISKQEKHKIPMEIQIRTSLEDVWGEIHHGLSYKNKSLHNNDAAREFIDSAEEHLINLKAQLDICARTADLISKQMSYAGPAAGRSTAQVSAFSVNLDTLLNLPLPEECKGKVADAAERVKHLFGRLKKDDDFGSESEISQISNDFAKCGEDFEDVMNSICEQGAGLISQREKCAYYLLMEAALCYYWAGRVLVAISDTSSRMMTAEEASSYYSKSISLYNRVSSEIQRSKDAILAYRMATVLSAQGHEDIALEKFREAVGYLQKYEQENLTENHFLRIRIPRQLGIAIWEEAERFRLKGEAIGATDFLVSRRRNLYLEAIEVTHPLLDNDIGLDPDSIELEPEGLNREMLMTANNVLDYSLCYLRSGGSISTLEKHGLGLSKLKRFVDALEGPEGIESVRVPVWADTLRAAKMELLDDIEGACVAARRVQEMLTKNREKWVIEYDERIVDEMLEDAKKTLDKAH